MSNLRKIMSESELEGDLIDNLNNYCDKYIVDFLVSKLENQNSDLFLEVFGDNMITLTQDEIDDYQKKLIGYVKRSFNNYRKY